MLVAGFWLGAVACAVGDEIMAVLVGVPMMGATLWLVLWVVSSGIRAAWP